VRLETILGTDIRTGPWTNVMLPLTCLDRCWKNGVPA